MKAYLMNMHLLQPRSRSSAKVKVKYKGYISQKMAVSGAFVIHKHILFVVLLRVICENIVVKKRICSWWAISRLGTKFSQNFSGMKLLNPFNLSRSLLFIYKGLHITSAFLVIKDEILSRCNLWLVLLLTIVYVNLGEKFIFSCVNSGAFCFLVWREYNFKWISECTTHGFLNKCIYTNASAWLKLLCSEYFDSYQALWIPRVTVNPS